MTIPADIETVTVPGDTTLAAQHAYVDWPAIIAGILLASAVSLVMLGFGYILMTIGTIVAALVIWWRGRVVG